MTEKHETRTSDGTDEAEKRSQKQLRRAVIIFAIVEFFVIAAVLYYKS